MSSIPAGAPTLCLIDSRFRRHDPGPSHPESPWRHDAMARSVAPLPPEVRLLTEARPATLAELQLVHSSRYIESVLRFRGRAARLNPDTALSEHSVEAALCAAGAGVDLALSVYSGQAKNSLALVRPPGHHAERDRAMGFCLFNNVAVAAAALLAEGAERVAIVDWDVHFGNGTAAMFAGDDRVLFASSHQRDLFPYGQGNRPEAENLVYVPLRPGAGDSEVLDAFREEILPRLEAFAPQQILVSAGFDAHRDDPLANLQMSDAGFGELADALLALARVHCEGRLSAMVEGGYDTPALERCCRDLLSRLGVA